MSLKDSVYNMVKNDIFSSLLESEIDEEEAAVLASRVYNKLHQRWGGCEIYIPKKNASERYQQIKSEFNGRNHAEVCSQFEISLSTFYRAINS